ncbi:MAG: D-alanyl-D-alanine carboxypeptidase family protein, partial [bacterium]|nr:D-alanyl-D-alanine carboxypeptidase family protein [bacterium]
TDFDVRAEGVVLASADKDEILYTKNDSKRLYPASITKLMTALLLIEKTPDLDAEIISVSDNAVKSLYGTGSSVAGLKPGEQYTAKQMLYMLLMVSGNDVALTIAEHVGQTVDGFVDLMNERALELGMVNTHYMNPHGLHDDNHYTTAYDVYLLTKQAITHSIFTEVVATTRYKLPASNMSEPRTLVTTNYLIDYNTGAFYGYYYEHATGLKTGYTDEAGRCLVSTADKDGMRYICVLLNSPIYDQNKTMVRYEFADTKKLFEWAFNDFEYKKIIQAGSSNGIGEGEVKVKYSWDVDYLQFVPETDFSYILPKDADNSTVTLDVHLKSKTVKAPVKKGEFLGTADVIFAGEVLGTINVVAANSVERSIILYILDCIVMVLTSVWVKILLLVILFLVVWFVIACIYLNYNKKKSHTKRYIKYKEPKK